MGSHPGSLILETDTLSPWDNSHIYTQRGETGRDGSHITYYYCCVWPVRPGLVSTCHTRTGSVTTAPWDPRRTMIVVHPYYACSTASCWASSHLLSTLLSREPRSNEWRIHNYTVQSETFTYSILWYIIVH